MSELDADTAVHAVAADTFAATVSDRWNAIGGRPNGGSLLVICMQALRRELHRSLAGDRPHAGAERDAEAAAARAGARQSRQLALLAQG